MINRNLIKIFFVLMSYWSFGQEVDTVQYSLLFKDCCSNSIKTHGTIYSDWSVNHPNGTIYKPKNNIVHLVKSEKYFLTNKSYGILNQPINLTDSITTDTIIGRCIRSINPTNFFTWNLIYLNCNDTISGNYSEYYSNGKILLNGSFENGRIKDSMVTYYSNGQVKSSIMFTRGDTIYKTFYPNGQISHLYNSSKRNTISYFKDGSVKSKRSNSYKKEFSRYSPKQLWYKIKDSRQISYYRNGKIKQKLKRKPLFFIGRFKPNNKKRILEYVWTIYDTTGTKVKEINFYSKNTLYLFSVFFYDSAKKFNNVSYFENGKRSVSFFCEYYNEKDISIPVKYTMLVYKNGDFKYTKDLLPNKYKEIINEYEIKYKQSTKLKHTALYKSY